jgi:hypothetical protein
LFDFAYARFSDGMRNWSELPVTTCAQKILATLKVLFMDAVASFAEEIALFGLAFFGVVFFEALLLTRDFFVIAMLFPQEFGIEPTPE